MVTLRSISAIIDKYSTSKEDTLKMLGELRPALGAFKLQTMRPRVLSSGEAAELGYSLPVGWNVKLDYDDRGLAVYKLVSPDNWLFDKLSYDESGAVSDYMATNPEGQTFTKVQLEETRQAPRQVGAEGLTTGQYVSPSVSGIFPEEEPFRVQAPAEYAAAYDQSFKAQSEQLSRIISTVFPSIYKSGDLQADLQSGLDSLVLYAQTNPDAFRGEILNAGRSPDTEQLLTLFGLDETEISSFFEQEPPSGIDQLPFLILKALPSILPERMDETIDYYASRPDALRADLVATGRNPDTEALVKAVYPDITERGLKDYFKPVGKFWKGILDFVFNPTPEQLAKRVGEQETVDIKKLSPIERQFVAGFGDIFSTVGGAAHWLGQERLAEEFRKIGQPLREEVPFPEMPELGWKSAIDPKFWSNLPTFMVRTTPFTISLIPAMIAGYAGGAYVAGALGLSALWTTILGAVGATALSRPIESALEAGGAYDEALLKNMTPDQANEAANKVFLNNMKLAGWDITQIAGAFLPTPARLAANPFLRVATIGGKIVVTGLSEGGEEGVQEVFQKQALGEPVVLDQNMKLAILAGGIMGAGMGGGGAAFTTIKERIIKNMPSDMRAGFDVAVQERIEKGFSQDKAVLVSLDDVAKTPRGKRIVEEAVSQVQKEDAEMQLKASKARQRVIPPPAITPEVTPAPVKIPEVPIVPEPVKPTPKEPWQMTRAEYIPQYFQEQANTLRGKLREYPGSAVASPSMIDNLERAARAYNIPSEKPLVMKGMREEIWRGESWHKTQIEQALAEGKPVPPEVLKDYPDLAAKTIPKVTPEVTVTEESVIANVVKSYSPEAQVILQGYSKGAVGIAQNIQAVISDLERLGLTIQEAKAAQVSVMRAVEKYSQATMSAETLRAAGWTQNPKTLVWTHPDTTLIIDQAKLRADLAAKAKVPVTPEITKGYWRKLESGEMPKPGQRTTALPGKTWAEHIRHVWEEPAIPKVEAGMPEAVKPLDIFVEGARAKAEAEMPEIMARVRKAEQGKKPLTRPLAKDAWILTLEQYIAKYGKKGQDPGIQRAFFGMNHRAIVEKALSEGKPVPAEVLKNYPDLAKIKPAEVITPPAEVAPEVPITEEVTLEPEEPLSESLQLAYDEIRVLRQQKATTEQVKESLVKMIKKHLPLPRQGEWLAKVKNVKTEADLVEAIARVQEVAEAHVEKTLRADIIRELKKTAPRIEKGITVGRLTPDVQPTIEKLRANLLIGIKGEGGITRNVEAYETARAKIVEQVKAYQKGKITWDALFEANEELKYVGMYGMSSAQLQEALDYIQELKRLGKDLRKIKREAIKEQRKEVVDKAVVEVTGGEGIKPGVGTLRGKDLAGIKKVLDQPVNSQYGFVNLLDKLGKFAKGTKQYQGFLMRFANLTQRAVNTENAGREATFKQVRDKFREIYNVAKTREATRLLTTLSHEDVDLGTFKITTKEGIEYLPIKLTKAEMMEAYQLYKNSKNLETFKEGMHWTPEIMTKIVNTLTEQDVKWADWLQNGFYDIYYDKINPFYQQEFNIDMPKNPDYVPQARDFEAKVDETDEVQMLLRDQGRYASVTNKSLKARQANIRPFQFKGVFTVLTNHIVQMEHFMAWAETMHELRSTFGNTEVRTAIRQYHSNDILKRIDDYMNDFARGGVDRVQFLNALDKLRSNFAVSVLAIKPSIGLQQIWTVGAFMTEMKAGDFVTGMANFWLHPIENYKWMMENSAYLKSRYTGGNYERDIRLAQQQGATKTISGQGNIVQYLLWQVTQGDKFGVMPGWWAKYQAGLKDGQKQADAMVEADLASERTQNTSELASLSWLQRGSSFGKFLTMFQSQPNKYFRIVADNIRNMQYGRQSKIKGITNLFIIWVLLPALFQWTADAFKFKKERQARILLLGPLNNILVVGQLIQTAWGWFTDDSFDWQVSPVLSTVRDLHNFSSKLMKIIGQVADPYEDVVMDDIVSAIEFFSKGIGQIFGAPTPYLIMVERAIRSGDLRQLIFSKWALEEPKPDLQGITFKLLSGLGEVIEDVTDLPVDKIPPVYDTAKAFAKVKNALVKTLPSDVTEKNGFAPQVVAIARAIMAQDTLETFPNKRLFEIIDDIFSDDTLNYTFSQYYMDYQDRQKITSLAKLKEWDAEHPRFNLGNVTPAQFALMRQYEALDTKAEKIQFRKDHPEMDVNLRDEWLKSHPKENAQLAVWGQAKVMSQAAYDEAQRLLKELDIPDSAVTDYLPPKDVAKVYFDRNDIVEKWGANSWEDQLLQAKNPKLRKWLFPDSDPIDTPIASLELKVKNRALSEEFDSFSDKDSPNYKGDLVKDADGKTARDKAQEQFRAANPDWLKDLDRIAAYSTGTRDKPTPDDVVEKWVDHGNVSRQSKGYDAEEKVWYLDNPDIHKWALDNKLSTDDGAKWNEPALRIDVEWRKQDMAYETIDANAKNPDTGVRLRDEFLVDPKNKDYRIARLQREAYKLLTPGEIKLIGMDIEYQKQFVRTPKDIGSPDWNKLIEGISIPVPRQYKVGEITQLKTADDIMPLFFALYQLSPETQRQLSKLKLRYLEINEVPDALAAYTGDSIGINPRLLQENSDYYVAEVIAHETAHHYWPGLTTKQQGEFWTLLNRPENTTLLESLQANWEGADKPNEAYAGLFARLPTWFDTFKDLPSEFDKYYPWANIAYIRQYREQYVDNINELVSASKLVLPPDEFVESYVKYYQLPEKGSRRDLYLIDHEEFWSDMDTLKGIKGPDPKDEPIIRINVQWEKQDAEFQTILDKFPGVTKEQTAATDAYLKANPEYAAARIQRNGYNLGLADVTKWVAYSQLPDTGFWRERYRKDNPDFDTAVKAAMTTKGQKPWADLEPAKIPTVQYDQIYDQFKDLFDQYNNVQGTEAQRTTLRQQIFRGNPAFKENWYRRNAYALFFPEQFVENFVVYNQMPDAGYARERYLKENPEFYKTATKILGWKDPIDFSKVPSKVVENKYNWYLNLLATGKSRMDYRLANPDLDNWLVLAKGYKKAK